MLRIAFWMGLLFFISLGEAQAQLPLPGSELGKRLPNDNIEGSIWEYKAKPEKEQKKGEEELQLEGKFRLEDSAIFDVSPTFKLPSKKEVDKVLEKVKSGKGVEVKLPAGPQQKRIGEFRKLSGDRIRLDFNDKDSLHGIMIISQKKKSDSVWIGTYQERDGEKLVRKWNVEVRQIED
jgi:hypothetical protein